MAKFILLNYDVHKTVNHDDLKKQLLENGWEDKNWGIDIKGKKATGYLPNTSLIHRNQTIKKARIEFMSLVETKDIIRLMCYEVTTWNGRIGTPHADNK